MIFLYFLVGSCFGSFFDYLLEYAHQEQPLQNRSYCDFCHHSLAWYDLIPIYSYCHLKGKCRYCGIQICSRSFFTEILFGFLSLYYGLFCSFTFSSYLTFLYLCFVTYCDLCYGEFYPLYFYSFLAFWLSTQSCFQLIHWHWFTFFCWTILAFLFSVWNQERWLGDGDLYIIVFFTLLFPFSTWLSILFWASTLGILYFCFSRRSVFVFLPFLCAALYPAIYFSFPLFS